MTIRRTMLRALLATGTLLVAAGTLLAGSYLLTRPASDRRPWVREGTSAPIR